jgi:aromatic ring-opening dioxygenase catalytic subunit (LigB family)
VRSSVDSKSLTDREHSREEGILVLSGGLTVHNLQDRTSFAPETANPLVREFNDAVSLAISLSDVSIPCLDSTSLC